MAQRREELLDKIRDNARKVRRVNDAARKQSLIRDSTEAAILPAPPPIGSTSHALGTSVSTSPRTPGRA